MTDSNAKQREYYKKNKESMLASRKVYYAENKDRIIANATPDFLTRYKPS